MHQDTTLGMVLVISGPSGVGKDTVWQTARPCSPTFERVITCTTRVRRSHEVEGVNYYFVDGEEFERMIRDNELIEYAQVHGNWYGVPSSSIFNRINAGQDVTCVIDVQGAQKIREQFPQAFLVFIKPPPGREMEILAQRITGRDKVEDAELTTRLQTATRELELVELYDATIVNDDLQRAAQELCDLIEAEKARRQEFER